jgi:hypothetical protein
MSVLNILNTLHNLRFSLSKNPCSCIIHILNTECAKNLKENSGAKGLTLDCKHSACHV